MALGSQQGTAETLSEIAGLVHDTFYGGVLPYVRAESKTAMLFQEAGAGDFQLVGDNIHFACDLEFPTGAMATNGMLPDHVGLDPAEGTITPIRRYRRIALDNFVAARASGAGAYDNQSDRIFDVLWNSWKYMEIRHSVGPSSCLVGVVESRTSSTVFVINDAFGNTDTNPLAHLSPGSVLAWWDITATAAIDGAGKISSIAYSTRTITMDSATTWEPGDQIDVGDLIYFATTNNISTDYFISERNLGPNGFGTIGDPAAAATTVFGIAESDHARWKPYRKASTTFDHLEVTEHWQQLGTHRGFEVTPGTDVAIAFPSAVAQLARSLMAFQQQAYTGGDLKGGYGTVTIANMPVQSDPFFYHNVFATMWKEGLYRANLGGEADFLAEDGAMWSRIADFDGKEAQVGEYMQTWCTNRGANGLLTGITTDVTDSEFTNIPDY